MIQYLGKRNCIKCTRWRPVSDYKLYNDGKQYRLRTKCEICIKKYNCEWRRKKDISPRSVYSKPLILKMKSLRWTNKMISDNAKVDVRRVYAWLHGKENIGLRAADNLCIALGIDLNSLIK